MPSAGRSCACGLFKFEEFHLPTNRIVLTNKSQNLSPSGPKYPGYPKPASLVRSVPGSAPSIFLHLLLSALQVWRLCAPAPFPRSVHSNAQRQNLRWCRTSCITLTNYYYLRRIGSVPKISAQPVMPVHPLASGQKPNRREIAKSVTRPRPGSSFFPPVPPHLFACIRVHSVRQDKPG